MLDVGSDVHVLRYWYGDESPLPRLFTTREGALAAMAAHCREYWNPEWPPMRNTNDEEIIEFYYENLDYGDDGEDADWDLWQLRIEA